jgi:phosphoserine aminotransferase
MNAAVARPAARPAVPHFSSGPCAKRPGWSLDALKGALVGRSHRASEGKARIAEVLDRSRAILGLPKDWRIGIVPASDTGAVEMALCPGRLHPDQVMTSSVMAPRPVALLLTSRVADTSLMVNSSL